MISRAHASRAWKPTCNSRADLGSLLELLLDALKGSSVHGTTALERLRVPSVGKLS